ncbi:P-type Na+/K+ transporter [Marchantia polymorpha subsp. ruderalis]|uniref:Sodium/potassium exporting P-type ATPase 1 n=2 Tax=Marchantia polymorpha TaxID=3197 RepID=A0AAF6BKT6_MARPO|nr:hypothetical protein MARPO_0106s0039 [Marchantia polymorpha]BBN12620.1 hypothetical protein Mp_5g21600 [Marchantia polymorpha subsp. ruderalis]|eukprot:PTQ31851.1 hypothetical protein MARPO_0106s0039 [Marchantia polymorpha]
MAELPDDFHARSIPDVSKLLETDAEVGLGSAKAAELLVKYGRNELQGQRGINPWRILLQQVTNGLTLILTIATVVSIVVEDYAEAGVLIIVILFNTIVGFVQDFRAERTMDALRKMASPSAKVLRDGVQTRISSGDVVPGDVIIFEVGDIIPADCRLCDVLNMEIDEAMLTGESMPAMKSVESLQAKDTTIGDRFNMAYSSTTVSKGRGKGIAVATGMATEIGKISTAIDETPSSTTPLQRRLNKMAYVLFVISIFLAVIVFAVNKFNFNTEIIIYAIALSIAVIPEGLIAVITVVMALGVKRMARQNAIVRKLVVLESMQPVTNICSDKTGTLTQGKMALTNVWIPSKEETYRISGQGYETTGSISYGDEVLDAKRILADENFHRLVECSALCNTANIIESSKGKVWGDPTEIALQVFAYKLQMGKPAFLGLKEAVLEFPFSSASKRMSMVCSNLGTSDDFDIYTKGAENVLEICDKVMDGEMVKQIGDRSEFLEKVHAQIELMATQGLRVLVTAHRRTSEQSMGKPMEKWERGDVEKSLTFLGLVGIRDTPRVESKISVQQCHDAGIKVHMLTGDHKSTALAIATEIGIIGNQLPPSDVNTDGVETIVPMYREVMTAGEFDALSNDEVDALEELPLVIARCTPATKVRMIEALHRRKKYAAMTGDGVNDAPSLKKADVGIAMGAGSDVAKQSSEIVLTDNNFATIVLAMKEGRRIFSNIKKFVVHLMSTNVGQVIVLIVGLAFQDSEGVSVFPLSPVQILFMNMVTGTPPAMSLGIEPASSSIMHVPPQLGGLFTKELMMDMFAYGSFMGGLVLIDWTLVIYAFGHGRLAFDCNDDSNLNACDTVFRARSTLLMSFTWMFLLHAYNCRHLRASLFTKEGGGGSFKRLVDNKLMVWSVVVGALLPIPFVYIPTVNTNIFKQASITWEWGIIVASVLVFFVLSETYKLLKRKLMKTPYVL